MRDLAIKKINDANYEDRHRVERNEKRKQSAAIRREEAGIKKKSDTNHEPCPKCGSRAIKNGKVRSIQRYICTVCGNTFQWQ